MGLRVHSMAPGHSPLQPSSYHIPTDLGCTVQPGQSPPDHWRGTGSCLWPSQPAYRAGIIALVGKVIQALVLQLLSNECDHGQGPVSVPRGSGGHNSKLQEAWATAGSELTLQMDFRFTEE